VEVSQLQSVRRCTNSPGCNVPLLTSLCCSVEVAVAQRDSDAAGSQTATTKRISFSLSDVNDLLSRLQVLHALFPPPASLYSSSYLLTRPKLSGHVQAVPASHTRERCLTLTAVRHALETSPRAPLQLSHVNTASQIGWIDFMDYITAFEEETVRCFDTD
jgi:hypothetical protein